MGALLCLFEIGSYMYPRLALTLRSDCLCLCLPNAGFKDAYFPTLLTQYSYESKLLTARWHTPVDLAPLGRLREKDALNSGIRDQPWLTVRSHLQINKHYHADFTGTKKERKCS